MVGVVKSVCQCGVVGNTDALPRGKGKNETTKCVEDNAKFCYTEGWGVENEGYPPPKCQAITLRSYMSALHGQAGFYKVGMWGHTLHCMVLSAQIHP